MAKPNLRQKRKQESHEKILNAASALFRKQGLEATGIDQIVKKAGLTAGAFYAHFKSKDHLIEAVLWRTLPHPATLAHKGSFLDLYLTKFHRDNPDQGCPLATLGSDLARSKKRKLKANIASKINEVIDLRYNKPEKAAKKQVLQNLSMAVGALILSRMTSDTDLSDEFLECYR